MLSLENTFKKSKKKRRTKKRNLATEKKNVEKAKEEIKEKRKEEKKVWKTTVYVKTRKLTNNKPKAKKEKFCGFRAKQNWWTKWEEW